MKPRFVGRLGLADVVTVSNAAVGFLAAVAATVDIALAARLLLLASIADALDGVVARRRGGTAVGPYLDSLADVGSFGVTPALLVTMAVAEGWGLATPPGAVAGVGAALFGPTAATRLGRHTLYHRGPPHAGAPLSAPGNRPPRGRAPGPSRGDLPA